MYTGVFFAVFDLEHVGGQRIVPLGRVQVLLAGMGMLNTMPLLATLVLEKGSCPRCSRSRTCC